MPADGEPNLPILAPQYRVDRELGAGGMGRVYLAHDLKQGHCQHDRNTSC